jgi:hypothetical protein
MCGAPVQADDESDFTSTPPASWTRLDPLGRATFDFSADTVRISVTQPTLGETLALGPGRAYLIAPTSFAQCVVSADLLAQSPDGDRTFSAVLARVQPGPGLGAVSGYSLSILNGPTHLQIHRLTRENPTLIGGPGIIPALNPAHRYRLVLICAGSALCGRIYDVADFSAPLVEVTATDSTYAAGRTGLAIQTDELAPIFTTFDDFLAWDGLPPPMTIVPGLAPGSLVLRWNARRGLASFLERSTTLSGWLLVFPASQAADGTEQTGTFFATEPQEFFRRRIIGTTAPAPAPRVGKNRALARYSGSVSPRASSSSRR